DYERFPTLLSVPTAATAQLRIAEQAYRARFSRGTEPPSILITKTSWMATRPTRDSWPNLAKALSKSAAGADCQYYLPRGPASGLFEASGGARPTPRIAWPRGASFVRGKFPRAAPRRSSNIRAPRAPRAAARIR